MKERSIVVISAGLRQPSSTRLLADRLSEAASAALAAEGVRATVRVVDLREHAHEVVDTLLTGFAPSGLQSVLDAVAAADGLIAVTPTFNASYSGLFKTFFDAVPEDSLAGTPVLIAATGGSARHSLALDHALRPMFSYLHSVVMPTGVYAATEDWAGSTGDTSDDGSDDGNSLSRRISRAAGELAREMARREPAVAPDPFALTTSFEQLLGELT